MNYIDIIILVVIVIGFILGFKDGLVRKIIGVIGLILGIIIAFEFSDDLAVLISPLLNDEFSLAEIVSGVILFSLCMAIFAILKRVIHPFDKVNRFINQFLGGLAGAIQIFFFISAFLLVLNIFDIPAKNTRSESLLYQPTYNVIPMTVDLIIGENSKAQNFLKDFIESKEDSI